MTFRHVKNTGSVLVVFFLVCFCATGWIARGNASQSKSSSLGNHVFTITTGGLKRSYVVSVPDIYNEAKGIPVVIMFHGGGGTAMSAMRQTGWAEKASQEGFLVVFPEGTRRDPSSPPRFRSNDQSWNDGSKRNNVGAVARKVDDVEFVRRMIDDLCVRFKVDRRRIHVTGFSNGASMAFRLARELPLTIAAIAPVAGMDWSKEPKIGRPVSMLYITGTADPLNPIGGGEIRIGWRSFGRKPPTKEMIRMWVRLLGCPPKPKVVCDKDKVKGLVFGPGKDGSEVALYTVEELGHFWPGGKGNHLPRFIAGKRKSSDKLKATKVIWEFFQKHPLRSDEEGAAQPDSPADADKPCV